VNKLEMTEEQINKIIDLALYEDIAWGDVTSQILIPPEQKGRAVIIAREKGVLAGGDIAKLVFLRIEPSLEVDILTQDGKKLKPGDAVANISGYLTGILKGERVALNFLSHLSGVASETARYVARVKGLSIITDTRKTSPGLRVLEKYAVRMGGGQNHRLHLGDGVLIKDNHIAALREMGMSLKDIIAKAKQNAPKNTSIEVEVNNVQEALEAAQASPYVIMLDNMSPEEIKQAVALIPEQVKLEASGGITLNNAHTAAMTGVDFISVGAITHSAKALDFSLEIKPNL
jgi:nicotinate-nucleotide pyrophosphorylase (carboxylating)